MSAALQTHANYFESSELEVYDFINGNVSGEYLLGQYSLLVAWQCKRAGAHLKRPGRMQYQGWQAAVSVEHAGVANIDNFGGVWVGDRTYVDPNKTFVPTPDNVVYIPPMENISSQERPCFFLLPLGCLALKRRPGQGARHTSIQGSLNLWFVLPCTAPSCQQTRKYTCMFAGPPDEQVTCSLCC